jgi:hypothetical protein
VENVSATNLTTVTDLGTENRQMSLLFIFGEEARFVLNDKKRKSRSRKEKIKLTSEKWEGKSRPRDSGTCWDKTSLRDKANLLPFQSRELPSPTP